MKNIALKSIMAVCVAALMITVSCKRTTNTADEKNLEAAKDNAFAEIMYNDIQSIADEASEVQTGGSLENYKTASNCATITHDTLSTPKTITIDFGATNCLCNDGKYRRGQILVSYMGFYKDSGSMHTITFNQYFVNDNQILGTKQVVNNGHNSINQLNFSVTVNGLIIKATSLDSIIWNHNRLRTMIQGENTTVKYDDVYSITGSGSGQRANGVPYTMNIVQPLIKAMNCQWIKEGIMEIQPQGASIRSIDYGNGNCDNQATVTVNGNTFTITLN
ncbi:MAG: hypothetical protein R2831_06975 [Chitinophagaceae bacterium]